MSPPGPSLSGALDAAGSPRKSSTQWGWARCEVKARVGRGILACSLLQNWESWNVPEASCAGRGR